MLAVAAERLRAWPAACLSRLALNNCGVLHVPWAYLSAAMLRHHTPRAVLCPMVAPGFDAVDMAERLCEAGYGGILLVVAHTPVVDPYLIGREIGRAGADLFRVEVLPLQ